MTTVNGRTTVSRFDVVTPTWTETSPEGRVTTTVADSQGRVTSEAVPQLEAVSYIYDTRGRLASIVTGTGADTRRPSKHEAVMSRHMSYL